MTRRLFLRHLNEATSSPPAQIRNVCSPDEGLVAFGFMYNDSHGSHETTIRLLALNVDDYPESNFYMLYTDDDNVNPILPATFGILLPLLHGKTVQLALEEISRGLTNALSRGQRHNPIPIDSDEMFFDDVDNDADNDDNNFIASEDDDDDDDHFGLSDPMNILSGTRLVSRTNARTSQGRASIGMNKIRADLKAAKDAGFRVGVIGNLATSSIVCVSIRVSKLGLSEEAMQAWSLRRQQYLVLLIKFRETYLDIEQVKNLTTLLGEVEMRVGLCENYKPHSGAATASFNQVHVDQYTSSKHSQFSLEPLFIGQPLQDLLRDRFAAVVRFREAYDFNWPSAEAFLHDYQSTGGEQVQQVRPATYHRDEDCTTHLPPIVAADSLEGQSLKDASLPLVAMQYLLRHFVRCTEFCLVCHCRVEDTFEALKPYVCSRPLCLYQYMTYGFGPSIEWEIISQPYVVDLLISFCYVAARRGRLKATPVGLGLMVPYVSQIGQSELHAPVPYTPVLGAVPAKPSKNKSSKSNESSISGTLDRTKQELTIPDQQSLSGLPMKKDGWLFIAPKSGEDNVYCRIKDVGQTSPPSTSALINIEPITTQGQTSPNKSQTTTSKFAIPEGQQVVVYCYDHNFDDLSTVQQNGAIITLLDSLPSVFDMKKYLEEQTKGQDRNLRGWQSRISEPALNLLRWIIASNRSCIMQVDNLEQDGSKFQSSHTSEDRVTGMDSYMQFRFAQGAPDKEQRFLNCVNAENEICKKQYPTLFAWHGSPLHNWHSIVREGLHFEQVSHGRAYGNGVYMSPHCSTSISYSGYNHVSNQGPAEWPNSVLKITTALSLNEVVNRPEQFVSRNPHYVVNKLDWIQTRYLFVRSAMKHAPGNPLKIEYKQDPSVTAIGEQNRAIQLPITAVPKSRRPGEIEKAVKNGHKKSKTLKASNQEAVEQQEDDATSVISNDSDMDLLASDSEDDMGNMSVDEYDEHDDDDDAYGTASSAATPMSIAPSKMDTAVAESRFSLDSTQTDFQPGTLDVSSIKFLDPPNNATSSATRALMQALKEALKTQESTPLHQLGWYVNPDHINNVYQWIVELHSFDSKLPLAKDMKQAEITSIVLEMRFTPEFPFSPPFVRVVRPRFLPFARGGGGHVTEGGAICMELLTNSGWSAVNSIESVLLQVRLAMSEDERPAKLMSTSRGDIHSTGKSGNLGGTKKEKQDGDSYAIGEAVMAYERACRAHGWTVPTGFNGMAQQGD